MSNTRRRPPIGTGPISLAAVRDGWTLQAANQSRGTRVATEVELALRFSRRARGLIGQPALAEGQGLLLRPCRSIHTLLMRYPIDLLFLDREGRVVGLRERVAPWRVALGPPDAYCTLELPAGTIAMSRTEVGDLLELQPSSLC